MFEEVVNMDVDARINNEKVVYKRVKKEQFHLDSTYIQTSAGIDAQRKELTSNASNKYNLMQHYLSDCTPVQVSAIDSLFQIVLQRAGISAKTVVKSIGKISQINRQMWLLTVKTSLLSFYMSICR